MMKGEVTKKYVKDLEGLLKEVDEVGDVFRALRVFPNEKMVIFLFGCLYRYFKFVGAMELTYVYIEYVLVPY